MLIQGREIDGQGLRALAAAARAFERAKAKGFVWMNDDGYFESHEGQLGFIEPRPKNPAQLRF